MDKPLAYEELIRQNGELRLRLKEATDTIEAIRTGQVDALVVKGPNNENQIFTLKTADQNYRVFIEKMNEGALTLNREGIVMYCNGMFASMMGRSLSGIISEPFESFVAADSIDSYRSLFRSGWEADSKTEILLRDDSHPDSTRLIPCQLSVTTLQLDEEQALSVIITDLTLQKQTQRLLKSKNEALAEINAELEASNRDLQQFASVASHDLQEPLRKILIFATMLQQRRELSPKGEAHLQKIMAASERMRTMIHDILSYSQVSVNQSSVTTVPLSELVKEVLEDCEVLITEKSAAVQLTDLPVVEVNRAQIKQVFQNLLSNSIKFSRPGTPPVIRISGEQAPALNRCTVTFADNGIGFDPQYRDRIFSLFERLNTKDKFEGSGIGLAITKKIIDRHEGTIAASSRPGEGAVFTITLPLRRS